MFKKVSSLTLTLAMVVSVFSGCATQNAQITETTAAAVTEVANEPATNVKKGATYLWNTKNDKYENFTDLGNYVIDVDPHTDL